MKIVYAGSPEFAVKPLESLLDSGEEVVAVITQPDKPTGRKMKLTPTPVKTAAEKRGLPVYDFDKIRNHVPEVSALGGDIMITCAYGQILSQEVLDCFKGGVWNLHASLLPLFRGASPIQSAILAGESHTGVTVMKTELALDSGDILLVKRCEIGDMTCSELTNSLSKLAAEAACEAVKMLKAGDARLLMQDDAKATFCKKIAKADCKLDFTKPAEEVLRAVKAFSLQPAAFCGLRGGLINILNGELAEGHGKPGEVLAADKRGILVACGKNAIRITLLQPSGGKIMGAADFVNGRKAARGDFFE